MSVMWIKSGGKEHVAPIKIAYPTKDSTKLAYNNGNYSPIWSDYDSTKMVMLGDETATGPGSYYTSFTPKEGYCWQDGSTENYIIRWDIFNSVWLVYNTEIKDNIYRENFEFTLLNTDVYWMGKTYSYTVDPTYRNAVYFTIPNGEKTAANSLVAGNYFLTNENSDANRGRIMGHIKAMLYNESTNYTKYRYDLYEIESENKTGDVLYAVTSDDASKYPANFMDTDGYWYELQ